MRGRRFVVTTFRPRCRFQLKTMVTAKKRNFLEIICLLSKPVYLPFTTVLKVSLGSQGTTSSAKSFVPMKGDTLKIEKFQGKDNSRTISPIRRALAALILGVSAFLISITAIPAQEIWTGSGNWSNSNNWLNNEPPTSGSGTELTFESTGTSTQDISSPFVLWGMTFARAVPSRSTAERLNSLERDRSMKARTPM